MARTKRYNFGGPVGGTPPQPQSDNQVGSSYTGGSTTYPFPQAGGSSAASPTSNTVVNVGGETQADTATNPFAPTAMRKGGFIRAADGIAKRGKTRGKMR